LPYCLLYCDENPIYVFPEKELRGLNLVTSPFKKNVQAFLPRKSSMKKKRQAQRGESGI
jgi:hypothetical protein